MAKSPVGASLAVAIFLAHAGPLAGGGAYAAECKRKVAGFYLEEMNTVRPHKLSRAAGKLPGSLTGVPGNAEHGRDVFIGARKGGCANCHRLSALPQSVAQGTIGPALDGAGAKYNEGELRQVLLDPKAYFPGAVMPSYYRAGDKASVLTAAEIEDLVAYLAAMK